MKVGNFTFRKNGLRCWSCEGVPGQRSVTLRLQDDGQFKAVLWTSRALHHSNPCETIVQAAHQAIAFLADLGITGPMSDTEPPPTMHERIAKALESIAASLRTMTQQDGFNGG
jgi:hypothetical protein